MLSVFIYGIETLKNNKMIKPEIDLELSINALRVYGIEPNIIKSMLSNLHKVVNKKCNIPHVSGSLACPNCGAKLQLEVKEMTNSDILKALKANAH